MTSRRTSAIRPLLLGACALAALAPAMARAQDEVLDKPAERSGNSAEDVPATDEGRIIVTGSRLARSTFDTPSPVTLLGIDDLQRRGITNIAEAITELPSFRDSTSPQTQGFGSFNVGARIANLRGLGVTRNLILVDGRRFAPTTREGSVDLNFIPSILISRTEVVTGGASAAYGSDAITGVINVILDDKYEGFKSEIDMGISDAGRRATLPCGAPPSATGIGDKGHFVIGGEYSDENGIGNCFTRDWCTLGAVVTNLGYAAKDASGNVVGNGLPNFVRQQHQWRAQFQQCRRRVCSRRHSRLQHLRHRGASPSARMDRCCRSASATHRSRCSRSAATSCPPISMPTSPCR